MSEPEIKKIVAAVLQTLAAENYSDNYSDMLNALTEIMLEILKVNEGLTTRKGYERIVECFTEATRKKTKPRLSKRETGVLQ